MSGIRALQVVEATFAGVGRHVLDLSAGLIQRGVAVDLLWSSVRSEPAFRDRMAELSFGRIERFEGGRSINGRDAAAVRLARSMAADGGYDVIHGHASKGGAVARLAGIGRPAPVVYTPNALVTMDPLLGTRGRHLYRQLEVALSRLTDAIVYVSPEEEAHAHQIGLRPRDSRLIPNGIEAESAPRSRPEAAAELGVESSVGDNEVVIGFVGRLSSQKNVGLLLEAYARVMAEAATPTRLVIVGTGDDEAALRERAQELTPAGAVTFAGHHHGARVMAGLDLFVLPSNYEGFPYVLLEALQAGVPCIATTGCSAQLLLGDGAAGRIVPATATALSEAIVHLVDDPTRRQAMATAGPGRACLFDLDTMTDATLDLYHDLVGGDLVDEVTGRGRGG